MIEVQHLTKRYGPLTAVDDVSFRVERGEILGFLGPNGAGKTTTMRVLTGYMPPTEGKAIVAGYDVLEQPIEAKRRTGYLPETPPLYPDMTVARLPDVLRADQGRAARPSARRASTTVMERTRIADMAKRHCGKLSKGLPAARRPRAGAAAQPRRADPRRADRGPRPEADHRDAPADQGARRRPHGHPEHAHPARGQPDLPARRHHQQGPRGGGRHARQPDVAAARIGDDVRAGGRDGRRRRRPRSQAMPGRDAAWRRRDTRGAVTGFEVDSETGRDVRRELAAPIVSRGWGLLELRPMRMSLEEIFLHLTTEDAGGARQPRRRRRMSNILAIAHKELKGYFASPIAYVVIGFSALLFGWFFFNLLSTSIARSMQAGSGLQAAAGGQRQRAADPPALPERQRDPAVRAAADHDADLLPRRSARARSSCC